MTNTLVTTNIFIDRLHHALVAAMDVGGALYKSIPATPIKFNTDTQTQNAHSMGTRKVALLDFLETYFYESGLDQSDESAFKNIEANGSSAIGWRVGEDYLRVSKRLAAEQRPFVLAGGNPSKSVYDTVGKQRFEVLPCYQMIEMLKDTEYADQIPTLVANARLIVQACGYNDPGDKLSDFCFVEYKGVIVPVCIDTEDLVAQYPAEEMTPIHQAARIKDYLQESNLPMEYLNAYEQINVHAANKASLEPHKPDSVENKTQRVFRKSTGAVPAPGKQTT